LADGATLDLVRFLARRIHTLPLLLVLSYRDALGPDHPLTAVLGDLVAAPGARRLQLTPLSRPAAQILAGEHGFDPTDVHRRTAGNPFFVSQILAQPGAVLPETVRDAVLARTVGLPPVARRCLALLSCTPEPVSGELLATWMYRRTPSRHCPGQACWIARGAGRVPARNRPVGGARRDRARLGTGVARRDDGRARGGRG